MKRAIRKKNLVFVSHISDEKEIALALKQLITSSFQDSIDVFVSADPASIALGKKWLDQITDALSNCNILIVICSPASVLRPWINFEAGAGWIRKIPVIPICHSGMTPATLPIPLKLLQAGNASEEKIIREIVGIAALRANCPIPSVDLTTYIERVRAFESTYKVDDRSIKRRPSIPDAITDQPEDSYFHFRTQRLITLNEFPDAPIYVTNQRKRALLSIAEKLSEGRSIQIGGTSIDPSDIYFGSVSLVALRSNEPVVKSLFSAEDSKLTDKFWAALRDLDDTDDITAELEIHNPYDKE